MSPGRNRRRLRVALAALAGSALLLLLLVFVVRPSLNLTFLKRPFEIVLSQVVESPVTVEKVVLRPGAWTLVRFSGLRIDSGGADVAIDFASVETVETRVRLLPLLRRELRLERLTGEGIELRLYRDRRDRGNWPVWKAFTWDITGLEDFELRRIDLEYKELASGFELRGEVDRLAGGISEEGPLELEIVGRAEEVPFHVAASGGTLAALTGAEPWPVEVGVTSEAYRLDLAGELRSGDRESLEIDLAFASSDLRGHTLLRDVQLPELGPVSLSGRLELTGDGVALTGIQGALGRTDLAGDLRLRPGGERPRIEGRIEMANLDLAPWLERLGDGLGPALLPERWDFREFAETSVEELARPLSALDLRLALGVARLEGAPLEVDDLDLTIGLEGGSLDVPVAFRLDGSGHSGRVTLDQSREIPALRLELGAGELRSESFTGLLEEASPVSARIGRLELAVAATGRTAGEMLRTSSIELDGRAISALLPAKEREPISLELEEARLSQAKGGPLDLAAAGDLAGEAFSIDLETANLWSLAQGRSWPFELGATGGGGRLEAEGTLLASRRGPELSAELRLAGEEIGALAGWLDVDPGAAYPYAFEGSVSVGQDALRSRLARAAIGRSSFSGEIELLSSASGSFVKARLHSPLVDAEELLRVLGVARGATEEDGGLDLDLDRAVLPSGFDLGEGDLDLAIDEVSGIGWHLIDVRLPLRLRDGRLERSPFSFGDDLATYDGALALDLRGEAPELDLELRAERTELERFLDTHEEDTGIDFTARTVRLELVASGATLREIIASWELEADLEEIEWTIPSAEGEEPMTAFFDRVTLRDSRDGPLDLEARGRVAELPVEARLRAETTVDLLQEGAQIPLEIELDADRTRLTLNGSVTLPLGSGGSELHLLLSGDRLDRLSPLVGQALPALGPYSLDAHWRGVATGDRFSELRLEIGQSGLEGSFAWTTGGDRPRLEAELAGARLVIEDLLPPRPEGAVTEVEPGVGEPAGEGDTAAGPGLLARLDELPARELLSAFDGELKIRVEELVWRGASVGSVALGGKLERGRVGADFHRARGGETLSRLELDLVTREDGIEARIASRAVRLDYGLLGQILGDDGLNGELSFDLDLRSSAPTFAELPRNAGGFVAFTDYPRGIDATILDLWGGQMLRGIIPALVGGGKPEYNCTTADLRVAGGRATPELLVADTSGSRIRGKGWIDLDTLGLRLTLKPRPKQRGLINLATTVRIRGTLADPEISFTAGGMAQTALRLYLRFWTIWRELLLRRPLPADGSDVCVDPPPRAFLGRGPEPLAG